MKAILNISALAFLLVAASSPCFGNWAVGPVSKERAKELGMEIRSRTNGTNEVSVELEIKTESELNGFSGRDLASRVELQIREGETCLVSATLREDRTKAGRVVVSFSAERARLDSITLRVWVGQGRGGVIHELRVKDFVDLKNLSDTQANKHAPANIRTNGESLGLPASSR